MDFTSLFKRFPITICSWTGLWLLEFENFVTIIKYPSSKLVKPILIMLVDGEPDENPRYKIVMDMTIHHFVKQNFDAMFLATNVLGRRAFNRVDRRIAPLSREVSGLIIFHKHLKVILSKFHRIERHLVHGLRLSLS